MNCDSATRLEAVGFVDPGVWTDRRPVRFAARKPSDADGSDSS
jgi:hypothetical protein